jgi:hypothetical protein
MTFQLNIELGSLLDIVRLPESAGQAEVTVARLLLALCKEEKVVDFGKVLAQIDSKAVCPCQNPVWLV